MTPPIVFLTDFGLQDGYVGTMKGVIHAISPDTPIIDLSHDIPPQQVSAAAFVLWNSYKYFPSGSIFVSVVDPGVGSDREIWVLQTQDHVFIAPNNGLLDWVMAETSVRQLFKLENPKLMRSDISHTFHGRDIFSPAAAHIARGFPLTQVGPLINYQLPQDPWIESGNRAKVVYIDHFGNAITQLKQSTQPPTFIQIGKQTIPFHTTYASVAAGQPLALWGSHGLLEIAVRNGDAANQLGISVGNEVSWT
ncbi:SAM-dependent chlorinase/fluorinase [Pontibacter sp. G13]|uniref:SAM hydrolase/SAM-dependent halogenase family protein n=1 Tax=Pontibacter sp. G13 TaxID=3074898 RepID=UPI0028891D1F|nr:SAM-dependent chlorinase/fluorinase [Pontibacter sp. G13]WNJ17466.1 SAM-dependent chlorinase/fluorinase [Pontibacter sp. G13]